MILDFKTLCKQADLSVTSPEESAADHAFYELWLAQPSWSPIVMTGSGWRTVRSNSGKPVPLTLGSVKSAYRREKLIGKRFGKLTEYLMIDIDRGSLYHPEHDGFEAIVGVMETLGLCRHLAVQSSESGGLHLYFPLSGSVSSWALADAVQTALTAAGIAVVGGQCELFPNRRSYGMEFNGHRLPLQAGSSVLDEDLNPVLADRRSFVVSWQASAEGQDMALLTDSLAMTRSRPQPAVNDLPPIEWTCHGESNEVLRRLTRFGHSKLGLKTVQSLAAWVAETAPRLRGFRQFASKQSRDDLLRRNWAVRWARSRLKHVRGWQAKKSLDYNASVSAEAFSRVIAVLDRGLAIEGAGVKKVWHALSAKSKELFGVGVGWKVFNRHREIILHQARQHTQLDTPREVTAIQNAAYSPSSTPPDSLSLDSDRRKASQVTARKTPATLLFPKDSTLEHLEPAPG